MYYEYITNFCEKLTKELLVSNVEMGGQKHPSVSFLVFLPDNSILEKIRKKDFLSLEFLPQLSITTKAELWVGDDRLFVENNIYALENFPTSKEELNEDISKRMLNSIVRYAILNNSLDYNRLVFPLNR